MKVFLDILSTMKENGNTVNVYVAPEIIIYTGYIERIGQEFISMAFEKGKNDAVIAIDKIVMVSVVK